MSIEFSKHAENASEAAEKSGKMPPFVAASGKRVCGFRIRTRENTPSDAETTPKRHPNDTQATPKRRALERHGASSAGQVFRRKLFPSHGFFRKTGGKPLIPAL
jgi:hypothetical protein